MQRTGLPDPGTSFLDTVKTTCDECDGKRYNQEAMQYKFKGLTINEVLEMTVNEAYDFFRFLIFRRIEDSERSRLDYLKLGQPLSTLSEGNVSV